MTNCSLISIFNVMNSINHYQPYQPLPTYNNCRKTPMGIILAPVLAAPLLKAMCY